MEVAKIIDVGKNFYSGAKTALGCARELAQESFKNPVVRANAKNALPLAILSAGAFSTFSLLPNRKGDGKQGKLERTSGKLASIAFAVAGFKKFFNVPTMKLKELSILLKKMKFKDALEILKTNKENIVIYALMVAGVRVVTDLVTKGLDDKVIEEFQPQKLGD